MCKCNNNVPGYETLLNVLARAYNQAAVGKGKERHANDLPFDRQPMQRIAGAHGLGFITGQAAKKTEEALGMLQRGERHKAVHELLGAINYLAGAVVFVEAERPVAVPPSNITVTLHADTKEIAAALSEAVKSVANDNTPAGLAPCPGCAHPDQCREAGYCLEVYRHG